MQCLGLCNCICHGCNFNSAGFNSSTHRSQARTCTPKSSRSVLCIALRHYRILSHASALNGIHCWLQQAFVLGKHERALSEPIQQQADYIQKVRIATCLPCRQVVPPLTRFAIVFRRKAWTECGGRRAGRAGCRWTCQTRWQNPWSKRVLFCMCVSCIGA